MDAVIASVTSCIWERSTLKRLFNEVSAIQDEYDQATAACYATAFGLLIVFRTILVPRGTLFYVILVIGGRYSNLHPHMVHMQ